MQPASIPYEWQKTAQLLESAELRNEITKIDIKPSKLPFQLEIKELIEELVGKTNLLDHTIHFQLIHCFELDKYLLLEPSYFFNKYRLITLRSEAYDEIDISFDPLKFKNYCRTKQEEAMKSGVQNGIWHHKTAEQYFGVSEEAGYLGGKGSSGWKYLAWNNFILDIYFHQIKKPLIRLAPYETLLNDGQLMTINKLFQSSNPQIEQILQRFLCRNLGYQLPAENQKP